MLEPYPAVSTFHFVDDYCKHYQDLFADVRNFEAFKYLHVRMISDVSRKSLPAIALSVVSLVSGCLAHRIPIAEDNLLNCLLLVRLLSDLRFEVQEVKNGQEALTILEQWEPHLIWMDMRMTYNEWI